MNQFLIALPPLIVAVVVHEVAHGWIAEKLGDPTARAMGRITANPIKHIDLFMTILLPTLLIVSGSPVVFGGAKPVPVNPGYFKNPRKDMAYVALAGPVSNFILALLCLLLCKLLGGLSNDVNQLSLFEGLLLWWSIQGFIINLILGLFNLLIPFPPLDGGRIVVGILPLDAARAWSKLEPYGLPLVFLLLYLGIIDAVLIPILDFAQYLL